MAQASLTACLLHNDPASCLQQHQVKVYTTVAVAKASPNWAPRLLEADPKLSELPMARVKQV